jgi:3-oxoacyl-[acyl-carrier-protein] synthase II
MSLLEDVIPHSKAHGRPSVGFGALHDAREHTVPRVEIASWSAVTPIARGDGLWRALLSGAHITDHARCFPDERIPKPRAVSLACRAAEPLVRGGLDPDAAVVVGTSKGTVEHWIADASEVGVGADAPVGLPTSGLSDIANTLASRFALRGPRLTVSAACASGLHALARGAMLIRSGEARQVLVVAAEASVHPLFLGSFQRLGVLAKPGDGCRPFDRSRSGFVMSEAAAAVVLRAADADDRADQPGSIYLENFAVGGDATHLTGSDPELRTLRHLLTRVIDNRPVDLVHAHGTGTPLNDAAELAAIESTLIDQPERPSLYSHKGAVGHSLGAAGLLSVVINCHAHAAGIVPPNVQTREPLSTNKVSISREPVGRSVRRSIAIAAGFGGATAVVGLISG